MLSLEIITIKMLIFFSIALIFYFILKFVLNRLNLSFIQRSENHHIHREHIPRVGGIFFISIFFILIIVNFFIEEQFFSIDQINFLFLICIFMFFFIGLVDDFFSINNRFKFIILFLLVVLIVWYFDLGIYGLIDFENTQINNSLIFIFSILCLFILIVSFNLIDGMNGLFILYSFLCIINYQFISYYFLNHIDPILLILNITLLTCLLFNFPYAKVFMGDGASYSIAFIIGYYAFYIHSQSILMVNEWYYACLLSYPIMELFFSFSRRLINKSSIFKPDKQHLHTTLYQYLQDKFNLNLEISNPLTTMIIILVLIIFNILTIYTLFSNQASLKYLFFFFCIFYIITNYLFLKNYNDRK